MINNQNKGWITKDGTHDGEIDLDKLLNVLNRMINEINSLENEIQQLKNR